MTELPIGKAIRIVRLARGFSQNQLGRRCGFPRTYVCNIENGIKKNPLVSNVERFAEGLLLEPWKLIRLAQKIRDQQTRSEVAA